MVFVIVEIGVNWDGDFELVKEMIEKAKEANCNAVKFQAFNEEIVKDHPERSRLMKSAITKSNIEIINNLAKSVGINWFCTPMYPDAVELLDAYVDKFKIREFDGRSFLNGQTSDLLQKVLKTKKEIIISCQKSPKGTKFYEDSRFKWLYCVPKYPCDITDLNFSAMNDFDGYSNHCTHFLAPLTAAILGAQIIEIHVTSDKSKKFFDNNVSFDYSELSNILKLIRLSEKIKK